MQKTKLCLLILPAALEVAFGERRVALKHRATLRPHPPPWAGAHVGFLKATERAHSPSSVWQLNTHGSHILGERETAAQTVFLEVISSSTVKLVHLKMWPGAPQSHNELKTYCVHICRNYQLSALCHPSDENLIPTVM